MFNLTLSNEPRIEVRASRHSYVYATDGSLPNPLESTYAALAGCAGVYARKACRELKLDESGIAIDVRIIARPGQPLTPARIVTKVGFPERFDDEQRAAILASIEKCAVKALMENGPEISFEVTEDPATRTTVCS